MYTIEEFDKEKTKILKYILYKKRSEHEVRNKFAKTTAEDLLEDVIQYLKEAGYIINLTDNKINKSKNLNLYGLHRCYPLSDSTFKMELKIVYRSIRY